MRNGLPIAWWSLWLMISACSSSSPSVLQLDVPGPDVEEVAPLADVSGDPGLFLELLPDDLPPAEMSSEVEIAAPELVDLAPQPGEAGYPCDKASDCLSDLCILTPDGPQCTQTCDSECPFGWQCVPYSAALPDMVSICVPRFVTLCRPCNVDADCDPDNIGTSDRCVPYPGGVGSFCGAACEGQEDCPGGYECFDFTKPGSPPVFQCALAEGECACDQFAVKDQASTDCYSGNDFGKCTGTRTCGQDGLTPCSAAIPAPETCNGKDDNCDQDIDEDTGGEECFFENGFGKCSGTTKCAGGEVECSAKEPMTEACDGADNNCDGSIDEGYPDTDLDGTADCIETDADDDGTPDYLDNCPYVANEDQANFDMDSLGDACDQDNDNDLSADDADCAPFDPSVHPGAGEDCNGIDDDCDDSADEDFPLGNPCALGVGECEAFGKYICAQDGAAMCDALPGKPADEICDGLDNDCNSKVDDMGILGDGCNTTGYPGVCAAGLYKCEPGGKGLFCDPLVLPGQKTETCANPGADDNCDGIVDNVPNLGMNCTAPQYNGMCQQGTFQCEGPMLGCVPTVIPGELAEQCNAQDDDCDGLVDEPDAQGCEVYFKDADKDNNGVDGDSKCLCAPLAPFTALVAGDCDDSDAGLITACDLLGDGSDGDLSVVGLFEMNATKTGGRPDPDGVAWKVTAPIAGKDVTLESISGLAKDDLALLIDLQGPGATVGNWEVVRIAAAQGLTVTLEKEPDKAYDTAADIVVLQRIPQYKKLTLSGEIRASPFGKFPAGTAGGSRATGIVAIKVRGALEIQAGSPAAGTPGTPGGGIILLWARSLAVPGSISAAGGAGGTGNNGQSRDGPG